MSESKKITRRSFIDKAAVAGAAGLAVPMFVSASALGEGAAPGANEKIGLALIGCGGMGQGNLGACVQHPDVVVTAACDPWQARREELLDDWRREQTAHHGGDAAGS